MTENLSRTIQLPKSLLEEGIKAPEWPSFGTLDEEFALMVENPGIPYSNPWLKGFGQGNSSLDWVELAYLISEAPIIGIYRFKWKNHNDHDWEVWLCWPTYGLLSGEYVCQLVKWLGLRQTRFLLLWNFLLSNWWVFKNSILRFKLYQPHTNSYQLPWIIWGICWQPEWNIRTKMTAADFPCLEL